MTITQGDITNKHVKKLNSGRSLRALVHNNNA